MAKRIPQVFIDDVLDKTSLFQLIDEYVPLKKEGANYKACCPFHQEKTPSFYVMESKGFYHCFGCQKSGNAISFLMDFLKHDFLEALEILAIRVGLEVPRQHEVSVEATEKRKSQQDLMTAVDKLYQQNLKVTPEVINYLKARGISGATAKHFHLGFAKNSWHELEERFKNNTPELLALGMLVENDKGNRYSRFRNRLMFPIFNRKGEVIAFGGRVVNPEDKPKYLNSPETTLFHKSNELYHLNHAKRSDEDFLLVVEGYMDVVALFEAGFDNACATLGTSLTKTHLERLLQAKSKLVFCFDGDNAGRGAALKAMQLCFAELTDGLDLRFMFLPEGEDPDSICQQQGREVFNQHIQKAQTINAFFINHLRCDIDLSTMAGRSLLVTKAKPYMDALRASSFKEMLLDELAITSRMDKTLLEKHLKTSDAKVMSFTRAAGDKPSMMRQALGLLVQHPALFHAIQKSYDFKALTLPGHELLKELLLILPEKKATSQLIEHYRDSAHLPVILKLANLEFSIPEDGILSELEGALDALQGRAIQSEIDSLLHKVTNSTITDSERTHLQRLIRTQKQTAGSE